MEELIRSKDTRYETYEELLLERDQVRKEAGQIWTQYVVTFGQLITDVYEEKLECIRCRKTIDCYQKALNRGGSVDPEAVRRHLEKEMASYYANLKRMLADYENCRNAGTSTGYEVQRSKALYRRLAKLIHPDIYPDTDRCDTLRELWQRILTAYGHNDIRALSELEVLVRKALKDLGAGRTGADIPDIEERIEEVKAEIHDITHTEPYIFKDLLEDEEAAARKRKELEEELEQYRGYRDELEDVIDKLINGGGIRLKWRMKGQMN